MLKINHAASCSKLTSTQSCRVRAESWNCPHLTTDCFGSGVFAIPLLWLVYTSERKHLIRCHKQDRLAGSSTGSWWVWQGVTCYCNGTTTRRADANPKRCWYDIVRTPHLFVRRTSTEYSSCTPLTAARDSKGRLLRDSPG